MVLELSLPENDRTKSRTLDWLLPLIGFLAAGWGHLRWYSNRLGDGSDEPLGALLFLVLVGWSLWKRQELLVLSRPRPFGGVILFVAFGILLWVLPNLLSCVVLMSAVVVYLGFWTFPGWCLLLALSLPVIPSLQFYLGYPLRLTTATMAEVTLQLLGYPITRSGVDLVLKGASVSVDPPCSGVRMLWAAAVLVAMISLFLRLNWRGTLLVGVFAFVAVIVANWIRALLLVFPESGVISISDTTHEMVGLACFGGTAVAIAMWTNAKLVGRTWRL